MHAKSLIVILLIGLPAAVDTAEGQEDREAALKERYDAFVESLDHRSLTWRRERIKGFQRLVFCVSVPVQVLG